MRVGVSEMVQWIKVLDTTPDHLSPIPGPHVVEEEK